MSRGNITSITPSGKTGIVVTFQLREGGERSYEYTGFDAAAILAGADPKNFNGQEVPTRFGGGVMDLIELAQTAAEIVLEL